MFIVSESPCLCLTRKQDKWPKHNTNTHTPINEEATGSDWIWFGSAGRIWHYCGWRCAASTAPTLFFNFRINLQKTKTPCTLKQSKESKSTTDLITLFFQQGNLSQNGKVPDKKQPLFHEVMLAREELPWARGCSAELFVLDSIVVCQGTLPFVFVNSWYYTSPYGVLYGNIRDGGENSSGCHYW